MVIKVQRPLAGHVGDLLIYNQSRTVEVWYPVDSKVGRFLLNRLGELEERCFHAWEDVEGRLHIGEPVSAEDW